MAQIIDLTNIKGLHEDQVWIWENVVVKSFVGLFRDGIVWVKDPNGAVSLTDEDYIEGIYCGWYRDYIESEREYHSERSMEFGYSPQRNKRHSEFLAFVRRISEDYSVSVVPVVSPKTGCTGWKIKAQNWKA